MRMVSWLPKTAKTGPLRRARTCAKSFQRRIERPERRAAKVAGQDADIVAHVGKKLGKAFHGALVHVDMHVADVKNCEAVEFGGKPLRRNIIVPDRHTFGITLAAPIQVPSA